MNQQRNLAEQMKALEHLQEIDLQIDGLKKNKSSAPAALKSMDDSLNKLQSGVKVKKDALGEIEKVRRQTRAALDLNQDRLARSSGRLESVQNSQEFQAASKEIEQLKKLNASLEEQFKKSETDHEATGKEVTALEAQLEKLQQEREQQAQVVTGQTHQLDEQIATLSSDRNGFAQHVEPRILAQYDRIRAARAGLGIVPAIGGRCKGCNMMVPPQLFNEIHRGNEVHSCPSCHRILYIPGSNSAAGPKTAEKEENAGGS